VRERALCGADGPDKLAARCVLRVIGHEQRDHGCATGDTRGCKYPVDYELGARTRGWNDNQAQTDNQKAADKIRLPAPSLGEAVAYI